MLIDIALYYVGGRGGVETVTTKVLKGLEKRGHKVRLVMAYPPPYKKWLQSFSEVHYYGLNMESETYDYLGEGYRNLMDKIGRPDLCIAAHIPSQSYICNLGLNSADHKLTVPILSWLHGDINIYSDPYLIGNATAHLAISSLIRDGIRIYDKDKKIYLVNNPIEINRNNIIKRPSKQVMKIISIGRLEEEKNLFMLLHALRKVNGKWQAFIIGEGSRREILEKVANILKINEKITWLGWQEEPWKEIEEASLCISTSNTEGFSMILAEALARGIPVIATNCGGPSDIVQPGINGWLVEKNDSFKVAEIINSIMSQNIIMPSIEACINSVEKFEENIVIEKIEKAIIMEARR